MSKAIKITIPITLTGLAGPYRCEGRWARRPKRSQPSDSLFITVTALPKATLTVKPNPAYTGETVTLTCSVGSDSSWSYQWYKDRNDNVVSQSVRHTRTGDTLTISRVVESDQGLYWCQGEIRSRSISSIISDPVTITLNVPPGSVVSISLPRLLCGLLVVSPFLLVSIVMMVKCCRARGLCSTVKSPQDQIRCDDVIEQKKSSV
ncbi:vascular endothelial growth factor receptor 2-like [Coregonus clupeaformis]|uniref:vascular endothelial growth factor receptor 2-like n=1 Tax=Coregonus clupeaformis TaxID=59861 RepID=UPI001E1C48AE|nr:vascular endothelial growth factor receptor 2-like [Coregonus clupeaformis]